jgi:hypothetical protein
MQVDIVAVTPDLKLGTDYSNVLGTPDMTTTGTLADAVATTQDVLNVRNFNYVYNGTTFDFVREGSVAGSVLVDLAGSTVPLPTGAATQATLADVETNTDYGATTGNGTATGALRVTVASDSTGALTVDLGSNNDVTIDNSSIVHAEDAVHGTGDAGIMPLAVRNDTLAALAGTDGDYAPIQVNATGAVYTEVSSALPTGTNTVGNVGLVPATSGGISTVYRDEDIDETAVACKGSAGQVYWIHCINLDATPVYLHFYDVAQGSVTVGTTGELMSFAVPSQGDANGAGFTMSFPHGIEFSTAITIACTTTIGGTAGPGANEVILNVGYE